MPILLLLQGIPEPPPLNPITRWEWVFPFIEAIHICGFCILVGTIVVLDLRLLGMLFSRQKISLLSAQLSPWIRKGLLIVAVTGAYLFTSNPGDYVQIGGFRAKMILLVCAITFDVTVIKRVTVPAYDETGPPWLALAACVSLALWLSVMVGGLWIGNL